MNKTGFWLYAILVLILIPLLSCCRKSSPEGEQKTTPEKPTVFSLVSPEPNKVIHCGDVVTIAYKINDTTAKVDSITLFSGKDRAMSVKGNPGKIDWSSEKSRMGQTTLRLQIFYSDSLQESHNTNLVILSDVVPLSYKYKVIAKYPHDNQAYTQGLIYDNGVLYESTGIEGRSSVRIVNIRTGEPVKLVPLPAKIFGEGIALFKNELYQVTYKSQVGYVYDRKTLSQIRSFDYPLKEGWGLTTDNDMLIMTDGSAGLYFIDPEFFTQVDLVNVFDNKGMIDSLNEIEFIKGKVLANVYGRTFIVIIDPSTGKVLGQLDCKDLMPKGFQNDYDKVLNGIAYNPSTGHLYITGKNWPVLYEIELIPAL
ncbi:MAG TPA: glutaminyl-peptide cyclotransferase [Bacteroidales bacterium]|nr:glutaminyl-peptide cyclotransferase [Bacteroidales bacterium]